MHRFTPYCWWIGQSALSRIAVVQLGFLDVRLWKLQFSHGLCQNCRLLQIWRWTGRVLPSAATAAAVRLSLRGLPDSQQSAIQLQ